MDRSDPEIPLRAHMLAFLGQCAEIVPVPLHRAEDMLALPADVLTEVRRDLAIEEAIEFQRTETDR